MRKSGGIIALIAGIFGTGAAFVTLFFGAVAGGLESIEGVDDTGAGDMILAMGWIGVVAAFATIILGAVAMNAETKKPGILLIIAAIIGAIGGGTFTMIFMLLAAIGGILTLFGDKKETLKS